MENNKTSVFGLDLATPGVPLSTLVTGNKNLETLDKSAMHKQVFDPPESGQEKGPAELAGGIKNYVQDYAVFPGSIMMHAGTQPPSGYLLCQGQAVSRIAYAKLFEVCGTRFGIGDGTNTFNVPDMRNKFPLGSNSNLGSIGGTDKVSITLAQNGPHTHGILATSSATAFGAYALTCSSESAMPLSANTSSSGTGEAHNNMPPYLSLNYIIKF